MNRYTRSTLAILMLMACSTAVRADAGAVSGPRAGDELRYWMHASTQVVGNKDPIERSRSQWVHYRVDRVEPDMRLQAQLDYLRMDGAGPLVDSRHADDMRPKWKTLFSSGFDLVLKRDTGALLSLRGKAVPAWLEILQDAGLVWYEEFSRGLRTPYVMVAIPPEVGAEVELSDFNGLPARLRVLHLTPEKLLASVQGDSDQGQLFAELVMARDSGRIEQMRLALGVPMSRYGKTGRLNTRLLMLQEQVSGRALAGTLPDADTAQWVDIRTPPARPSRATEQQLFAYLGGVVVPNEAGMVLRLMHDAPVGAAGILAFSNIQAWDEDGKIQSFTFAPQGDSRLHERQGLMQTELLVAPLGWDTEEQFWRTRHLSADLTFTPARPDTHTFAWQPDGVQLFDLDGIQVRVAPVAGQPLEYELQTSGNTAQGRYLTHWVDGLQGQLQFMPPSHWPEWLTADQRAMLNDPGRLLMNPERRWRLRLHEQPQRITFHTLQLDTRPAAMRNLIFHGTHEYARDPAMPPYQPTYLFAGAGTADTALDRRQFGRLDASGHSAVVALPYDLASACMLRVTRAAPVRGHELEWRLENDSRTGAAQLVPLRLYRLSTDDGVRQYFYDRSVSSHLTCTRTPQWQLETLPSSETPWLLPLTALDARDHQVPLDQLMQRLRLLDSDGKALALLDERGEPIPLDDRTLEQASLAGNVLRFGGPVTHIARLQWQDVPVSIDWDLNFPGLPGRES